MEDGRWKMEPIKSNKIEEIKKIKKEKKWNGN
jgi:hypothetical protein